NFHKKLIFSNTQLHSGIQGSLPRLRGVFTLTEVITSTCSKVSLCRSNWIEGFMSRRYQALIKSERLTPFDPNSSTNRMLDTGWGLPEIPTSPPRDITQAVVDFLHHNLLSHSFGVQREWEVRTTLIANRQAWRYRSRVFGHGKEASKSFPS